MTLSAWRIFKAEFRSQPLSGEGARRAGGRWNHRGTPLVYLAESIALASLELLVHLQDAETLPKYALAEIRFDSSLVRELRAEDLPIDWRVYPHPLSTKEVGREWVEAQSSAVLKLPSSVSPREANYLLNPEHPSSKGAAVTAVLNHAFDPRLFERTTHV